MKIEKNSAGMQPETRPPEMPVDNSFDKTEKVSQSSSVLLVVFTLILALIFSAGIYWYFNDKTQKLQNDYLSQIAALQNQIKELESDNEEEVEKEVDADAAETDTAD